MYTHMMYIRSCQDVVKRSAEEEEEEEEDGALPRSLNVSQTFSAKVVPGSSGSGVALEIRMGSGSKLGSHLAPSSRPTDLRTGSGSRLSSHLGPTGRRATRPLPLPLPITAAAPPVGRPRSGSGNGIAPSCGAAAIAKTKSSSTFGDDDQVTKSYIKDKNEKAAAKARAERAEAAANAAKVAPPKMSEPENIPLAAEVNPADPPSPSPAPRSATAVHLASLLHLPQCIPLMDPPRLIPDAGHVNSLMEADDAFVERWAGINPTLFIPPPREHSRPHKRSAGDGGTEDRGGSPSKRPRRPIDRPDPWHLQHKLDALLSELHPSCAVIVYDSVLGRVLRQKCEELGKEEMPMGDMLYMIPIPQVRSLTQARVN